MFFRWSSKIIFVITSLLATAVCAQSEIPCPSIETMRQAASKIDTAAIEFDHYFVYSKNDAFVENKVHWFISVAPVFADYRNEAIELARYAVGNISIKNEEFTKLGEHHFRCTYGPGEIVALGHLRDA